MKAIHNPRVGWRYWGAITLASIFGTNMGDLYAHTLHLGVYAGVGLLAVLAAVVFVAERGSMRVTEQFYWLVIVIIRTGATNIADYLAFRVRVPEPALSLALAAVVAVAALIGARRSQVSEPDVPVLPVTGPWYWIAMLGAGVFGTVVGDVASHVVGEGYASLALDGVLAVVLLAGRGRWSAVPVYWATIMIARTAGTAMGDWLAENDTLRIGLPLATLMTGFAFVAIVTLYGSKEDGGGGKQPFLA